MRSSPKRPKYSKAVPVAVTILTVLVVLGFYPTFFHRWILEPPLEAVRFILSEVTGLSRGSTGLWSHYIQLVDTEKDNQRLRKENEILHQTLDHYQDLVRKNEDLLALLELKKRSTQGTIACHVIANNLTPSPRTLLIDCGSRKGVQIRDGVMGVHGVVGYVVRVFSGFSQVLWIEDPMFALEGRLQDSGQKGLVRGQGAGHSLELEYIPALSSVERGAHVVTSGEDGYFPPEEPIGTVVQSRNSGHQIFRKVRLQSSESLTSLWAVMVFVPPLEWTTKPLLGKGKR